MAGAAEWQVYTHSLGTEANEVDGVLRGRAHAGKRAFYLELYRALAQALGIHAEVREVPFARGLFIVQHEEGIAFFNVSRTEEREGTMRWVGPISDETDYLYENARHPSGIKVLADAQDKTVCVLNGNVNDKALSRQGFARLVRNISYESCLRMLAAGRVDFVATAEFGLPQRLHNARIDPAMVARTPVVVNRASGYIALSSSVPDAEHQRWQQAFDKLRHSGRYQKLLEQYLD
ncbi:substrate-binding periplasmic protein [Andreprevotia lacus]|nr:transporter substrate-binding domain-containing protein [Andreprevotia lacus]